jgi:hypothetical protein
VIVNILVKIEGFENVKRVGEVNLSWGGRPVLENRQQMDGADDRISVHNGHNPVSVVVVIWFNDPHPIVRVRVKVALAEFVDKRTFEYFLPNRERK